MKIVNPTTWPRPKGYNHGITATAGNLVFIAGQIAWDENQRIVGGDDFVAQFDRALANLLTVLRQAGGRPEQVVTLTIFLTDKRAYLEHQADVGRAYRQRMGEHFPAMTLVEVKSLLLDDALVEIEGIAVIEGEPES